MLFCVSSHSRHQHWMIGICCCCFSTSSDGCCCCSCHTLALFSPSFDWILEHSLSICLHSDCLCFCKFLYIYIFEFPYPYLSFVVVVFFFCWYENKFLESHRFMQMVSSIIVFDFGRTTDTIHTFHVICERTYDSTNPRGYSFIQISRVSLSSHIHKEMLYSFPLLCRLTEYFLQLNSFLNWSLLLFSRHSETLQ